MSEMEKALADLIVAKRKAQLDWRDRIRDLRFYKLVRAGQWLKLGNYLLANVSRRLGLKRLISKPYCLAIDPTNACQLRCPFCVGGGNHGDKYLDYEIYEALMRELGPWLVKIDFCKSAEPLLHPRICDMVELASRHGLATYIASNCNHVPDPDRLMSCGLDSLMLSVDGLCQETYGRYRVGGDCRKVFENMRALVAARKRVGGRTSLLWNFLVFKYNEHEIPQAVEMAKEVGVDSIIFTAPSIPDDPELRRQWQSKTPRFINFCTSSSDPSCIWPWSGLDLLPDGNVSICYGQAQEQLLGHGLEVARDFGRYWNGEYMRKARSGVLRHGDADKHPDSLHCCQVCPVYGKSNFSV